MLIFDQLKKNDPRLQVLAWGVLAGWSSSSPASGTSRLFPIGVCRKSKSQSFRTVRSPPFGQDPGSRRPAIAENQPKYSVSLYLEELRSAFKDEWSGCASVQK